MQQAFETAWELLFERIDADTNDPADLALKMQIGDLHEYYSELQRYNPDFAFKPPPFVEENFDARYTAMQTHMQNTGKAYVYHIDPPPPTTKDLTGEARARRLGLRGVKGDAEWQWDRTLGQGGFGHAGLWERVGENGDVVDRVVGKESYHEHFTNPSLWSGPPLHRVPKEGALMKKINRIPDSENVLRCQGWRVYGLLRVIRIYVDYCKYGDLEQLIEIYNDKRETKIQQTGSSTDHYLPVRVIWAVFESLVAALCLLHFGRMPWHPPSPEWEPILHQDIKPRNIFPSRADVEHSLQTSALRLTIGASLELSNHRGQEQYAYGSEDADYNEYNPITLKSDIWAVGRTVLALMNLEKAADVQSYKFDSEYDLPDYHDEATEAYYPKDLRDLVELCLRDNPAERPDAMQLWARIQMHVGTVIRRSWLPMKMGPRTSDESLLELPVDGARTTL
ncbi:uncharacterized protein MYCFIDRAFT_215355 [Pseudocercospora fijiensis CIRAD86]|uniref:non-specific serine/threonine protein kinase n=1 Tax=Pseudocercospora fijiensis (strain CIRAD86) TaxID=383855 RepID=M2Z148_PSEFD|nr:uncharacterized protein MYCFIDRAFT_215355 [Pseudocercospora fijiensis CIRAD86]EME83565.1 hypothetical protein MYCFIDRAFT_215355 [Pseudocercospora fijiensis CIRAD86]